MNYIEISPEEATKRISSDKLMKDWYLISTQKGHNLNFMTGSCASVGNIWMKPVFNIFIRPQRYTTKFLKETNEFTITFLTNCRQQLEYIGSISGKHSSKIDKCDLDLEYIESNIPTVKQGHLVLKCKVIYRQFLNKHSFIDKDIVKDWYPQEDFSIMYIGEILKAYEKY